MNEETSCSTKKAVLIPAKIYCFIQDENGVMFAIIHSYLQENKKISVLTYQWELEFNCLKKQTKPLSPYDDKDNISNYTLVYHKVSIDTIQMNVLMIPCHINS